MSAKAKNKIGSVAGIYDKHFKNKRGKKAKEAPRSIPQPEAPAEVTHAVTTTPPAATRAALMLEAKNRGVKYFRILNKEELEQILSGTLAQVEVAGIIATAKERWQKGWGNGTKREKRTEQPAIAA